MPRQRDAIPVADLSPGEHLIREARAWLCTSVAPLRWEGALALTTQRVVFVPDVHNNLIGDVCLWLNDLTEVNAPRRARLHVETRERSAVFEVPGVRAFLVGAGRRWCDAIIPLIGSAPMLETSGEADAPPRRRVG